MRRSGVVVLGLLGWELHARLRPFRLTPPLEDVAARLRAAAGSGALWRHASVTLGTGAVGLALACAIGVPLGLVMAQSRWLEAALGPLLVPAYAVPKLVLYPAVALVLGPGTACRIWLIGVECFFPVVLHVHAAARAVDRELIWVARVAGATRPQLTLAVLGPACLPALVAAVRIACPIMLVVSTTAEMIGGGRGLGYLVVDAQSHFDPAGVLAVIAILGAVGFLLDRALVALAAALVWDTAPDVGGAALGRGLSPAVALGVRGRAGRWRASTGDVAAGRGEIR